MNFLFQFIQTCFSINFKPGEDLLMNINWN